MLSTPNPIININIKSISSIWITCRLYYYCLGRLFLLCALLWLFRGFLFLLLWGSLVCLLWCFVLRFIVLYFLEHAQKLTGWQYWLIGCFLLFFVFALLSIFSILVFLSILIFLLLFPILARLALPTFFPILLFMRFIEYLLHFLQIFFLGLPIDPLDNDLTGDLIPVIEYGSYLETRCNIIAISLQWFDLSGFGIIGKLIGTYLIIYFDHMLLEGGYSPFGAGGQDEVEIGVAFDL